MIAILNLYIRYIFELFLIMYDIYDKNNYKDNIEFRKELLDLIFN